MKNFISMLIFGVVVCLSSQAHAQCVGDVDGNGVVDGADVPGFITCLQSGVYDFVCDVNQDGAVNFLDIPPMINLINFDLGDVNMDGAVNFTDISPFQGALIDQFFGNYNALADTNCDGAVTTDDIPSFIAILQGQ